MHYVGGTCEQQSSDGTARVQESSGDIGTVQSNSGTAGIQESSGDIVTVQSNSGTAGIQESSADIVTVQSNSGTAGIQESSGDIGTRVRSGQPRNCVSISGKGKEIFSSPYRSNWLWGPTSLLCTVIPRLTSDPANEFFG